MAQLVGIVAWSSSKIWTWPKEQENAVVGVLSASVRDFVFEPYQMIARIGTEIVRFKSSPPPEPASDGDKDQLIQQSRQTYCTHADDIHKWLSARHGTTRANQSAKRAPQKKAHTGKDFEYDEFPPTDKRPPG